MKWIIVRGYGDTIYFRPHVRPEKHYNPTTGTYEIPQVSEDTAILMKIYDTFEEALEKATYLRHKHPDAYESFPYIPCPCDTTLTHAVSYKEYMDGYGRE